MDQNDKSTRMIRKRGFAGMDPAKQREIASKGGHAAHAAGVGHEWSKEEAREAGRKGGKASRGGRGKAAPGIEDCSKVPVADNSVSGAETAARMCGGRTQSTATDYVEAKRCTVRDSNGVQCELLEHPTTPNSHNAPRASAAFEERKRADAARSEPSAYFAVPGDSDACGDCGGARRFHGGTVGCVRFIEPGTPLVNPSGATLADRFGL